MTVIRMKVSTMRSRAAVLVALIALVPAIGTTTSARADGNGTLGGTPPELGVGLNVSIPGTSGTGHESYGAHDPNAPRPVFTRAVPASSGDGASGFNFCQIGPPDLAHFPLGNGWWFNIELFDTATGAYIATVDRLCVLSAAGAVGAPPAPTLPQPPTIGEIWNAVGLPTPPVGASPAARGITGLPTWVWTAGSAPVAVGVALDGYRVTGTARVVGYGVYSGEGGWVRSNEAGAAGDPASAHTYETTGTYRLGVATLWTATAVMTGPGLATPLTIDLGTAVVTNALDYPVVEIRSRLLP
jgi:hypothetical protein